MKKSRWWEKSKILFCLGEESIKIWKLQFPLQCLLKKHKDFTKITKSAYNYRRLAFTEVNCRSTSIHKKNSIDTYENRAWRNKQDVNDVEISQRWRQTNMKSVWRRNGKDDGWWIEDETMMDWRKEAI